MPEPIRCPPKNCLEIEHDGKQFGSYVATLPVGHTLEDVMGADYFGRMQARGPTDKLLRPGDFIDIRPADWSWYVRVMVRACLPTVDQVITSALVGPVEFEIGELPAGWSMEYGGIERKWAIKFRGAEKAAMFRSSEEAKAAIAEMSGQPLQTEATAKPRGKPGRKPKATADAEPAKEPEPA